MPASDELPELLSWADRPTSDSLAPLPNHPAVYLLEDEEHRPVLLATTQQLRRLLVTRLTDPERPQTGKADLAAVVRRVWWRAVSVPLEANWRYYRLAREMYPKEYRKLVSFSSAWFLHVDWDRPIPEIRVSDKAWNEAGEHLGPFPTRQQCQQALEGLWDLFDLCRYPEQVRKAPRGKACAYAEMGRCDAPCDGSVPLDDYIARNRSAWRFAGGGVAAWIDAAGADMQQAAGKLEFERAGLLKQQIDFAKTWQRKWQPAVRPLPTFNLLLAIQITRRKAWKLLLFWQGAIVDGPVIQGRKLAVDGPKWLGETLATAPAAAEATAAPIRMEQTWLIARFLDLRESDAAAIIRLPDLTPPSDTADQLAAAVAAREKHDDHRGDAEGAEENT